MRPPGTGQAFAPVLAETGAEAMQAFRDRFAAGLPERAHERAHAALLLLDGAGRHIAAGRHRRPGRRRPANISLIVPPPPHGPILDPVERIWPYPRGRFLSLRLSADLSADLDAVIDGRCDAWNRLAAEPGRIASRIDCPFLRSVRIS